MCRVIILTILSAILILPYANGDPIITEARKLLIVFEEVLISGNYFNYAETELSTDFINYMFNEKYLNFDTTRLIRTQKIALFVAYYEYRNNLLNEGISPKSIPLMKQIDETFMKKLCSSGRNSIEYTRKLILYIETLFDKFDIVLSWSGRYGVRNFQNCVEGKGFHVASMNEFPEYQGAGDGVVQCGRDTLESTYFRALMSVSTRTDDPDRFRKPKIFDAFYVFVEDAGLPNMMGGEPIIDSIKSYTTSNNPFGNYLGEEYYVVQYKTIVDFPPSDDENSVSDSPVGSSGHGHGHGIHGNSDYYS